MSTTARIAHVYHMTRVSMNGKTGPIPVTTTSRNSCPSTCRFMKNGCYAESGPLRFHWDKLSDGRHVNPFTLEQLCGAIKALPYQQLWRHNQAGDLPQIADKPGWISRTDLMKITAANKRKRGFTYTHHIWAEESKLGAHNFLAIKEANEKGFTVNVSCETEAMADLAVHVGLPAVLAVSREEDEPRNWVTPGGNKVNTCPATYMDMTCDRCGFCQKQKVQGPGGIELPRPIVAFPIHGNGIKKAKQMLLELRTV